MDTQKETRHALKIHPEACVGCSHCIRVCPTEALRVTGGKAVLFPDWCIDCGECARVCPEQAILVDDDDIREIFNYKHRVLLVPSVFYAQFDSAITKEQIDAYLSDVGFTEICSVEQGADILIEEMLRYQEDHPRPVISSFCPAVTRLIQVRFPVLVDHVMRLLPPVEIAALYYKNSFAERGIPPEELGIFYVTPCAAKIAAVKAPVGGYTSPIHGVINMDHLYNRVYLAYKNKKEVALMANVNSTISSLGARWMVTGGESKHVKGRRLAIDGMANIIEFLERLENDEIQGVDFLELRCCDESCSGGILTLGNRFLTVERLKGMAYAAPERHALTDEYRRLCSASIPMQPVETRSLVKYDRDIKEALRKMNEARKLRQQLPGIDCGACGAPSCEALSEDVVCRGVPVSSCIFMRTRLEKEGALPHESAVEVMESIWGGERFSDKR